MFPRYDISWFSKLLKMKIGHLSSSDACSFLVCSIRNTIVHISFREEALLDFIEEIF